MLDSLTWSRIGPFKWRRAGEESEKLGALWVELNGKKVDHKSHRWVQLVFPDGALFFSYEGRRTVLRATYRFQLSDDGRTLTYPPDERAVEAALVSADGLTYERAELVDPAK